MKKFTPTFLTIVFAFLALSQLASNVIGQDQAKFRRSVNGVANQYIVVLNHKYLDTAAAEPSIRSNAEYLGYVYGGSVKQHFGSAMPGYVSRMTERQAMRLSRDERVAYVEQDSYVSAEGVQASPVWNLDRVDQRNFPLDARYTYATDASAVHAYVIDSGIRTSHQAFGGRATSDYDGVNDGNQDCLGHGTHVAGTIGSSTWGLAKNVRLHSVRVLGCTASGTVSSLVAGIDWVAANRQLPAVANISINASAVSNALTSAVNGLIRANVTTVVSAGNYGADACNYGPANVSNAVVVGATGSTDLKPTFSNFGSCVDLWAPGIAVTSASNGDDVSYRVMNGTSMASPHVAGAAVLYLAQNPSANPSEVHDALVNSATVGLIGNLDAASPNRMVYSWFGGTPPSAQPATVRITKRAIRRTETMSNASFTYGATNLATSSFSLQPDNAYTDSNVNRFGTGNTITVTESQSFGWQLMSISCSETSSGTPNVVNSTVDLVNRRVNIVAEEGEQIECTFTSEEIAPSAAAATVTGRVVTLDGKGVRNVGVSLVDMASGTARTAYTNSFGYYSFNDVVVNRMYSLTAVSSGRYIIPNNVQTFTLEGDLTASSFIATR